jgi:hypothetical protein
MERKYSKFLHIRFGIIPKKRILFHICLFVRLKLYLYLKIIPPFFEILTDIVKDRTEKRFHIPVTHAYHS